jgi:hypothetical protein
MANSKEGAFSLKDVPPVFFVGTASKGLSFTANHLKSTFTRMFITVDSK